MLPRTIRANLTRVNEFTHGPIPTVCLKGKEVKAGNTGNLALALTLNIFSNSCAMHFLVGGKEKPICSLE